MSTSDEEMGLRLEIMPFERKHNEPMKPPKTKKEERGIAELTHQFLLSKVNGSGQEMMDIIDDPDPYNSL
jgi:hypothetical protein